MIDMYGEIWEGWMGGYCKYYMLGPYVKYPLHLPSIPGLAMSSVDKPGIEW